MIAIRRSDFAAAGNPTDQVDNRRRPGYRGPPPRQSDEEEWMAIQLGDEAPDFTADTTEGTVNFHEWLGNGWGVLFSHPKDFTPVCTTELGAVAKLKGEFEKRNAKVIAVSVDPLDNHGQWMQDIQDVTGAEVNFPLIADPDRKVAD